MEGYCLYLTSQYNKKPNEVYQSSAVFFTGALYDNFSSINKYLSVSEMADSLAAQNAALLTKMESSKYNNTIEKGVVKFPLDTSAVHSDTIKKKEVLERFNYIAAEVIDNSIVRVDNYLTINRGSSQGVQKGMGVINSDGIVGIVRNVTPHYAQVMSILHKQASISAMIKNNRNFGSLVWKGNNPKHMSLENIPKHVEVVKGDTIETSGYSEVFPGGLRIGTVADVKMDNGTNFYSIDVLLSNDISNIRYVFVVGNIMAEELKQLKQESEPPPPVKKKKKVSNVQ